ncbi:MAG: protoporphyrinogen oxidase [Terriglobia bacterium]
MTKPDATRRRIAVLGGGIAGLTAAYVLAQARRAGAPIEEYLIEAQNCLGGVIKTETVDGFVVEAGPDSFLTEKPAAAALCHELGLGDSLLGSNESERRTYILHKGKLVPLPDGLILLVPTRTWSIAKTPLLPLRAKLAIVSEWLMSPPGNRVADESVADFVRRHFGSAMLENIADPLLAGVYGGDSASLSARSVLNRFWQMEKKYGSLTRGTLKARRQRKLEAGKDPLARPVTTPPIFTTLRNGLGQVIEALSRNLETSRAFLGQRVLAVESEQINSEKCFRIRCDGDISYPADAIIFALPAFECSRLLAGLDPPLAESLGKIPYNSALTVALGYDSDTPRSLRPGFGFLVPKKENRRLLACTFVHAKFSHRAPPGRALLRCFLGGSRDPDVLNLSDEAIVALVRHELAAILKLSAEPLFSRVHRSPRAMAQYVVGHEEVVSRIHARLDQHPEIALAGNAYSGIGISDCVRTGRASAERMLLNIRQ